MEQSLIQEIPQPKEPENQIESAQVESQTQESNQTSEVPEESKVEIQEAANPNPNAEEISTAELSKPIENSEKISIQTSAEESKIQAKSASPSQISQSPKEPAKPAPKEAPRSLPKPTLIEVAEVKEQESQADKLKQLKNLLKDRISEAKALIDSALPANEKIKLLIDRLTDQIPCTKMLESEIQSNRKRVTNMAREKESLINELSSEREMRRKLENYCREIQKQNRQIQDECKSMTDDEKKKREELTEKLNNALKEVTSKFEENEQERIKQIEENENLKQRMQELGNHAIQRDDEYQKIIMQKDLETQLCKVQLEYKAGFKEAELKNQLVLYKDRFEEFSSTITKSNSAFETIRAEVKKVDDRLQAEQDINKELRKRKEKADIGIVEILTAKNNWKKELAELKARHDALKGECSRLLIEKKNRAT
ncbi:unnamed protein product [Blepharisma stoltei]|uniref:Uncharacterized protein n=1 Tax=Blepharisma stoltei TaxID=1481888 RepID=A0AAU9JNZ1_9CILI|nr:unnamed protein product [Blepharisma stoltei]